MLTIIYVKMTERADIYLLYPAMRVHVCVCHCVARCRVGLDFHVPYTISESAQNLGFPTWCLSPSLSLIFCVTCLPPHSINHAGPPLTLQGGLPTPPPNFGRS